MRETRYETIHYLTWVVHSKNCDELISLYLIDIADHLSVLMDCAG